MTYWQTILEALKELALKLVSFKNLVVIFGTIIGAKLAQQTNAPFKEWAAYELGLFAMFYATNQIQKYLIRKYDNQN